MAIAINNKSYGTEATASFSGAYDSGTGDDRVLVVCVYVETISSVSEGKRNTVKMDINSRNISVPIIKVKDGDTRNRKKTTRNVIECGIQ